MKTRYICLVIHTERLHNEKIWKRIQKLLKVFRKFDIRASWFSINPTFVGYQAMGFDEMKWRERLRILIESNQSIEQHTHFYKGKKGVSKGIGYDLSAENVKKRLREDREWLKKQGVVPKGFLSGAWRINNEILKILAKEGYQYDLSINNFNLSKELTIKKVDGILEIPATCTIKRLFLDFICLKVKRRFASRSLLTFCTVHFHDYDLGNFLNYFIILFLILIFSFLNFQFISIKELYERINQF